MEVDKEPEQISTESEVDEETELSESPFNKLAPEVTGLILGYLNHDIPSKMAASGVCGLWKELVDWKQVKRLHLDFEHMQINNVSLEWNKWAPALESLLPKVELSSIWVTLPYKMPDKQDTGKYTPSLCWPLWMLDCGVVLHKLISTQQASFASVKAFNIQASPCSAEFEFACHLLQLCTSMSTLKLILLCDRFPWSSLEWALCGKAITSLSITICRTETKATDQLAQLCQVLAPGTLKDLAVSTNVMEDHQQDSSDCAASDTMTQTFSSLIPYDDTMMVFDQFCFKVLDDPHCFSALEYLHFDTMQLHLDPAFDSETNLGRLAMLVNLIMPKLKAIEFNIIDCNAGKWVQFHSAFKMLSKEPSNHPVDVTFISTHHNIMKLFVHLTENTHGDVIHMTKEGFVHYPITSPGKEPLMKFIYKRRLLRPSVELLSCACPACRSEYQWMKGEVLKQLRSPTGNQPNDPEHMDIFSCQVDRLKADLVEEFPTLEVTRVEIEDSVPIARIRAEEKEAHCCMFTHNSHQIGDLCMGCGMMME